MYIVSLPVVGVVWFEGRSGGAVGGSGSPIANLK